MNIFIRLLSAVFVRGGLEYMSKHHPTVLAVIVGIFATIGTITILHWLWYFIF